MPDIELFQIANSKVSKLEGELFQIEKSLQSLIESNLEKFLGVRFLASEYYTGQQHGGRIDTIGIDKNNHPVIIEYKRKTNENVINQILFYVDWLLEHKAEFELLVQKRFGSKISEEINWKMTRLICIAGGYKKYDISAVRHVKQNIELMRYKKYTGLLLFELVNSVRSQDEDGKKIQKTLKPPTAISAKKTIGYISSLIGNPHLSSSTYYSIYSAIKNPNIYLLSKSSVKKIFNVTLENCTRDIENHERGGLFKRLIEYGPLNPDETDISKYPPKTFLSDEECISAVNFIYSHVINRFKGDLAELLAIKPCLKLFEDLKQQNKISLDAQLCFGDYIKEYQSSDNLAKGADGLIVKRELKTKSVFINGVIEVKSMYLSQNKLLSQINKHITRLKKGIKLGDLPYPSNGLNLNPKDVIRIMVVPSLWQINKIIEWVDEGNIRKMIIPEPDKPNQETTIEEIEKNVWKITLDWSKEALEQAAYELTFDYMSRVGIAVFKNKSHPKGWEGMSPEEAGYNSIKEKLYYILLRRLTQNQYKKAIKLYNVYSFGYPLGIDSKEMLWPEDIK